MPPLDCVTLDDAVVGAFVTTDDDGDVDDIRGVVVCVDGAVGAADDDDGVSNLIVSPPSSSSSSSSFGNVQHV